MMNKFACCFIGIVCFVNSAGADSAAPISISELDKSVVRIIVFDATNNPVSSGSGFIVANGIVATNHHVIEEAHSLKVLRKNGDSFDEYEGSVSWKSPQIDLALIKAPSLTGQSVRIATIAPTKAQEVIAFGFPGVADDIATENFAESTITKGVIGRLVKARFIENASKLNLIQHSAQINRGNSGGPLFNQCGAVIGINTLKALGSVETVEDKTIVNSSEGVYWAVSSIELVAILKSQQVEFSDVNTICVPTSGPIDYQELQKNSDSKLPLVILMIVIAGSVIFFGVRLVQKKQSETAQPVSKTAHQHENNQPRLADVPAPESAEWILSGVLQDGGSVRFVLNTRAFKNKSSLLLGRDAGSCDLVIDDASVSRRHAHIELHANKLTLQDLGSKNGSFVNETNSRGMPIAITTPCTLTIGNVKLRVVKT
jgi:hypothetical protein